MPFVEPTLDIETLADARRNPGVGNDRLPERSVRRGEHDRKQHGLDERELSEHDDTRESAGHDRQRQPDREQAKRQEVLAAQCREVDPRRVREEDDRQRRLGYPADGVAPDRRVEPPQNVRARQDAADDEHHRRSDHRPQESSRDRRVREDEERNRDESRASQPSVSAGGLLGQTTPKYEQRTHAQLLGH
jgi:hypothetical protein